MKYAEQHEKLIVLGKFKNHTHPCKTCSTKRLGKLDKGRVAWNNKKRKISSDIKVGSLFVNSSGYIEVYVGNAFCKKQRKDKYRLLHKLVAQAKKGSHLDKHELVHHVDGDKTSNNPDNLFVCKSKAHHQDIHTQLEQLSMSLVKAGIIQFSHETGEYHLPHLKEILNEYSVNSEETYVLELDDINAASRRLVPMNVNSLGNMAILSQAESHDHGSSLQSKVSERCLEASDNRRLANPLCGLFASEGATTIDLSSRVQADSKRGES